MHGAAAGVIPLPRTLTLAEGLLLPHGAFLLGRAGRGGGDTTVTPKSIAEMSSASLGHSSNISPQTSCWAALTHLLQLSEVIIRVWSGPAQRRRELLSVAC